MAWSGTALGTRDHGCRVELVGAVKCQGVVHRQDDFGQAVPFSMYIVTLKTASALSFFFHGHSGAVIMVVAVAVVRN
jgi:hypothetical protein